MIKKILFVIFVIFSVLFWSSGGIVHRVQAVDSSPPIVYQAIFINSTTVDVIFSEALDSTTAQTTTNYTLSTEAAGDTETISSATLQPDNMTVRVVASGASISSNGQDSIRIQGVKDVNNNTLTDSGSLYIMTGWYPIVISEVLYQTASSSTEEFIELYNRSDGAVDLDPSNGTSGSSSPTVVMPLNLHFRNDSGTDSVVNFSLTTNDDNHDDIPSGGYFLIASTDWNNSVATPTPDATYDASSAQLTDNGSVYISNSTSSLMAVIDKLGWGMQVSGGYEGTALATSTYSAGNSFERKANSESTALTMASGGADANYGNAFDSENNNFDFVIRTVPQPQNTSSATETQGGTGYGEDNTPPSIMHMPIYQAATGNDLEIFAQIFDDSGQLSNANTGVYYCASGGGTSCDEASEFTLINGSGISNGWYKFIVPSSVLNAANDLRYILYAQDPVDSNKVMYMSQSPSADMTCNDSCNTGLIFQNPFTVDIVASAGDQHICGIVKDASNNPLSGVSVFLEGTAYSTTTPATGIFDFSNVWTGGYNINTSKEGYMPMMMWQTTQSSCADPATDGLTIVMNQGSAGQGGDYDKPNIMWTQPPDSMNGVPLDGPIYIVFDRAMDSASINDSDASDAGSHIYLTTDGTTKIAATVSYYADSTGRPSGTPSDPYLAIFQPLSNLNAGTFYTLVIDSTVISEQGNPVQGNRPSGKYITSFTTAYNTSGYNETSGGEGGFTFGSGAAFPPYIVGVTPGPGSFDVPTNAKINVVFDEAMTSNSITTGSSGTIRLYRVVNPYSPSETSSYVASTINLSTDGEIATIEPNSLLSQCQKTQSTPCVYRIKVYSNATSVKGVPMGMGDNSEMFSSDFEVGSAFDSTAPTVQGTYPNNGDTGIPVNLSTVELGFSEDMDPSTINSATVKVKLGSNMVASTVDYDPPNRAAKIYPNVALSPGQTYTIYVVSGASGVKDVAGNALASDYIASFTADTSADTTEPSIEFANCDDFVCAVTYSESMTDDRAGDTNWSSSVVNKTNYTLKEATSGTTNWSEVSAKDSSSWTLEYEPTHNTVIIRNVGLTPGNDFQITVTGVKDRSNNSINTSGNVSVGPINNSRSTGGMMGPGGPGPMMGPPTMTEGSGGMYESGAGGHSSFDFGGHAERPTNVMPMNIMAGATGKYFIEMPLTKALTQNSSITLTFPSGFNVSSAQLVPVSESMANKDINGPGPGVVTIGKTETSGGANNDGVEVNVSAGTITITIGSSSGTAGYNTSGTTDDTDFITFELKGIKNSSVPKGFETNGYTVDIKTKDANGKLLESMTSFPFFITGGGNYTLSGTITTSGSATVSDGETFDVMLGSPMTGPMETTATFSSGSASYSFTNLPEGEYNLFTKPNISLATNGGSKDYVGYMTPDMVRVNSNSCSNNTCTKNFQITDASSGAALTVYIVGDFRTASGISSSDRNIDIFAGCPQGFTVKSVQLLDQNYTATSPYAATIYLPYLSDSWSVGIGPAIPKGTMIMGPPPMPSWMPPQNVQLGVAGSLGSPTWTENSAGGVSGTYSNSANDGKVTFNVSSASNQIVGYVIDGLGNGISNADVFANRSRGAGIPAHAVTDSDGKFILKVTTGVYTVGSRMPGLPPSPETSIEVKADTDNGATDGNSTADVYMNRGTTLVRDVISGYNASSPESEFLIKFNKSSTTISGKVTDGTNPISYAPVWAYNQATGESAGGNTDSSGNFVLYAGNGTWTVKAHLPDYGDLPSQTVTISDSSVTDIVLRPSVDASSFATIIGTVMADGSAVNNASVWIDATDADGQPYHNDVNTNSLGAYVINTPSLTGATLHAWLPDYGELAPISLGTITAGTTYTGGTDYTDFTVAVGHFSTVTANFTNNSALNSSTEGFIDIFAPATNVGNHKYIPDLTNVSSTILKLPYGAGYKAFLHVPGIGEVSPDAPYDSSFSIASSTVTLNFTLPSASNMYTLTGTVYVDTDGDGSYIASNDETIEQARVWLENFSSGYHNGSDSDSSGSFTLKMPAGTFNVGVDRPGYTGPAPFTLIVGGASSTLATVCDSYDENTRICTKNFALSSNPYTITGIVYKSDGSTPVTQGWVWADKVTSATDFNPTGGWTGAEIESDGTYSLSASDGYWLIRAVSEGYSETTYKVNGQSQAVHMNSSSLSGKNIILTARSGYSAKAPKLMPITPANGGTIDDSSNTGVKVTIPAAALGSDTSNATVQIEETNSVPNTTNINPLGSVGKEITATNNSGQTITDFSGSVGIEISYSEADIPAGYSESQLTLSYFDQNWIEVPAVIDTVNNKIRANVTHFTTFAVSLPADNDAPTTPGDPSVSQTNSNSVSFSWTASSDTGTGVAGYEVFRSTDGINYSTIGNTNPDEGGTLVTGNSYTDSGLNANTTYYYKVRAYDNSTPANKSASSGALTVTTSIASGGSGSIGDAVAPAIQDIETEPKATEAIVNWQTQEGSWTWVVYGLSNSYGFEEKDTAYQTAHSVTLSGLSSGTTYHYQIKSRDKSGNIGYSGDKTFTTLTSGETPTKPATEGKTEKSALPKEGDLIQLEGDYRVYVVKNGVRQWIKTAKDFENAGYQWNDIKKISQDIFDVLAPPSSLERAEGRPEVYLVKDNLALHIATAKIFNNAGLDWNDIKNVSRAAVDSYIKTNLVRVKGHPEVYILDGEYKRWIKSPQEFEKEGYDWSRIIEISETHLNSYQTEALKTIQITAHLLNVRSAPSLSSKILTKVKRGTICSVLGENSGWYKVKTEKGIVGWLFALYAKVI